MSGVELVSRAMYDAVVAERDALAAEVKSRIECFDQCYDKYVAAAHERDRLTAQLAAAHGLQARAERAEAALAEAVANERAACAQVCQDHGDWCMAEAQNGGNWAYLRDRSQAVLYMAEKIRARAALAAVPS